MTLQEASFDKPQPRCCRADAEMSALASLNENYCLKQKIEVEYKETS